MIENKDEIINEIIESNLSTDTKRILIQLVGNNTANFENEKIDLIFNANGGSTPIDLKNLPFIFKNAPIDKDCPKSDIKIEPVGDN